MIYVHGVGGGTGTIPDNSILEPKYGENSVSTRALALQSVDGTIIETDVTLAGDPITTTQARESNNTRIATTAQVRRNRPITAKITGYSTGGQPVNTLLVSLDKIGGVTSSAFPVGIEIGDIIIYEISSGVQWSACVKGVVGDYQVQIPTTGLTKSEVPTVGFTGSNLGLIAMIYPVR
jgi:hypothetical protein